MPRRVTGIRQCALAFRVALTFVAIHTLLAAASAQAQVVTDNGGGTYAGPARRAPSRPITLATPVEGTLTPADLVFGDGSHFQVWKFAARAGQDVVIALGSRDFGAFLMLVAAAGVTDQPLQMAMADTATREAQLAIRIPTDGDYLIVANTQQAQATGRYQLSVRAITEACAAGGPCAVAGTAGGITPIRQISASAATAIALDAPRAGELTANDAQLGDSSRFNVWRYDGRAGERIVIDQVSSEFDTYLILTRQTPSGPTVFRENDDAPITPTAPQTENSQIAVELPETGPYLIIATSFRPNTTGQYRLTVRAMEQVCAAGGPCAPSAPPAPRTFFGNVLTAESPTIALGDTVRARLSNSDRTIGDGTYFNSYRFRGSANDEVAVFLSSRSPDVTRLDPYLHLLRSAGDSLAAVKSDDDGGGQKNSLITARLPVTGEYFIVANGLTVADTGNYTLTVMRLADACTSRQVCTVGADLRQVTAGVSVLAVPAERIALGSTVTGRFDTGVAKLPDGKPFVPWRYTARAGERTVITNRSSDFDAYLYLYAVRGDSVVELSRDDDGAGELHAQIATEFAEAGDYLIVAGSFAADAQGDYRLTLEAMDVACAAGGPCSPGATSAATARILPALAARHRPLPALDTVRAELTAATPRLERGGRYHAYRFRGAAGDSIVITMETTGFDAYLHLALIRGAGLRLIGDNDDGGPGTDARLVAVLPESGEYLVVASALGATDTTGFGTYAIRRAPCDSACAAYEDTPGSRSVAAYQPALNADRRRVPRNGEIDGTLTATDATLTDGAHFHAYWVEGTRGATLRAALQSTGFDPYVVLMRLENDALVLIATDDDSGEGTNALLEWPVDRNGTYVVIATAYGQTSLGEYSLSVEQGPESAGASERFRMTAATAAVRPQLTQAMAAPSRPITIGRAVTAEFAVGAPELEGRGRFQSYRFSAPANARVVVTMVASQFDTYLYLAQVIGSAARLVGMDDDGGGGTNSRIKATLPAAGEYLVIAAAFNDSGATRAAAYTVKVDPCDDACVADTAAVATVGSLNASNSEILGARHRTLTPGTPVDGELLATDPTLSDGSHFQVYTVEATRGMTLRAAMTSAQFDTYLAVYRIEGDSLSVVARDDDGGGGTNARLEWAVDRTGRYLIVANALTSNTFGVYTLTVSLHNP